MLFQVIFIGIIIFFLIRIIQRLYFRWKGHKIYHPHFSPKQELEKLIKEYNIPSSYYVTKSNLDQTDLVWRKLGKGPKVYMLANGVGTGFFMWYAVMKFLLICEPALFDKITLLLPSYRGLFKKEYRGKVSEIAEFSEDKEVKITVSNCVEDIHDILQHMKLSSLDGILGWSTGAQVALCFANKYSSRVKSLALFNPSTGNTLHYTFQAFFPLPLSIRKHVSKGMNKLIHSLKPLIPTNVWDRLKYYNDSTGFFRALSVFAFFGGFPPDQPIYFHEYMKDAFSTRCHTRALLDLILCLDEALDMKQIYQNIHQETYIFSGYPDFLTGIYHSKQLAKRLKQTKHIPFTMGSHFLIIEWPEVVAKELIPYFLKDHNEKKKE